MSEPWKKHLAALGKDSAARPAARALFAPAIFAAAAQIEGISPAEMAGDPTRLGKCLDGARQLLGLSALMVHVPALAEAEALGSEIDSSVWPPVMQKPAGEAALQVDSEQALAQRRLAASIELCRRVSEADANTPLIATLTGPATLVSQITQGFEVDDIEDYYEAAGGLLLALVRVLGEAGLNAVCLQEEQGPGQSDDEAEIWADCLAPVVNVARFHKLPLFMTCNDASFEDWPDGVIACPSGPGESPACVMSTDWRSWSDLPDGKALQVILTAAEIEPEAKLADLRAQITQLRTQ